MAKIFILFLLLGGGGISKYDDRAPSIEYYSSANIFDAERCIVDWLGTLPRVYKQSDRPNSVMILWGSEMKVDRRLDLLQTEDGLLLRGWRLPEPIECAPKK